MERLSSTSVSHLHSEVQTCSDSVSNANSSTVQTSDEVAQIEHFAEQLVGHMAKDQAEQENTESEFHPDPEAGLQVCTVFLKSQDPVTT